MRALIATSVALATLLPPLSAGAREASGVKGVLLDTTCFGPCVVGQQPKPYTGNAGRVLVRRFPDREVVALVTPEDGHFKVRLSPGTYRVRGDVAASCWEGEAKRVHVRADHFRRVRLRVYNACIV